MNWTSVLSYVEPAGVLDAGFNSLCLSSTLAINKKMLMAVKQHLVLPTPPYNGSCTAKAVGKCFTRRLKKFTLQTQIFRWCDFLLVK
jgi:hypothetical protein